MTDSEQMYSRREIQKKPPVAITKPLSIPRLEASEVHRVKYPRIQPRIVQSAYTQLSQSVQRLNFRSPP